MPKPFTGDVSERTAIPFEAHQLWDSQPFGAGDPIQSQKGPAMLRNESQRVAREEKQRAEH